MTRHFVQKSHTFRFVLLLLAILAPSATLKGQMQPRSFSQSAADKGSGDVNFMPAETYFGNGSWPEYSLWSLAVADVNGDGKPDVIVVNFNGAGNLWDATHGAFGVLLGNGDGTFQPIQTTYLSQSTSYLAIGDVNGDGKADLVISSCCETNNDGEVAVLLGNGDGTFQSPVNYDSGGGAGGVGGQVILADLRKIGKLDIITVNWGGSAGVLLGNGDGTFRPATSFATSANAYGLAVADLNRDGNKDIVVLSLGDFGSVTADVLLGNGDGTFQPFVENVMGSCGMTSLALADVNGDGVPDLVGSIPAEWACTEGTIGVALGNGTGGFQSMVAYDAGGYAPNSVEIADVNGDTIPDLIVANECGTSLNCENQSAGTVAILTGNSDGTFQAPLVFPSSGSSGASIGSLAVADLNGDGKPDVVVENLVQNNVAVLLNGVATTTRTHLEVSPEKSEVGQPVTFTARVTARGGIPPDGGVVSFLSGGTVLGTSTLSGGIATLVTSSLPAGTSLISATYAGAPGFAASTSGTRRVVVRKVPTGTTISSNLDPAPWGAPVTFTAVVTPSSGTIPDGDTVVFIDDYHFEIGSAGTVNGVATITASNFRIRNSIVQAEYLGDSQFAPSHKGTFEIVEKGPSSITLSSSPNPSEIGQTVTFAATVTSPVGCPISGGVVFSEVGEAKLNQSGVATITKSTFKPGSHTISAYYGGNTDCTHSETALIQVVQ